MAANDVAENLVLDEEDTDGNGRVDFASGDSDGDGTEDVWLTDWNEDGNWDNVAVDADGFVVASERDSDADGVVDQTAEDTDGDGIMDTFSYDTDGDGEIDEVNEVDDPMEGDGGVYGEAEDQYYQYQEVNGLCGPAAAAMIISEQTGEFVSFEDVAQTTLDMDVMNEVEGGEYDGTYAQNMVDVMAAYGVASTIEYGDLSTLEGYLEQGRDVMVTIDANETWEDGPDSGTTNHFVVVTEIDEENGVVTMNDPGRPDGSSFQVPLETFVDAWADGGNEMVVTETAGVEGDPTGSDTDTDDTDGGFDTEDLQDLIEELGDETGIDFEDIFALQLAA